MKIDADAHVVETDHTWDYMDDSDVKWRPVLAHTPDPRTQYWIIDGKVRGFRFPTLTEMEMAEVSRRAGRHMETPIGARELDDVELRLRHMDQLGIDIQVLHNTLFIEAVTDRPEVDVAICKSWNRWMADLWRQGKGRFRWSCVPPLLSIPEALEQIRFARENGAVAIAVRPIEGNRLLFDPYFYPIYEEASRLDMAIAVHIANGNPYMCDVFRTPYDPTVALPLRFRLVTVGACMGLILSQVPRLFPTLRWGFIESAAQWVPWVYKECARRVEAGKAVPDFFRDYNIYVTCQTDDDLPYILQYTGEDNIVTGTDYGHTDPSVEIDVFEVLREKGGLTESQYRKIVDDNPRRLYSL